MYLYNRFLDDWFSWLAFIAGGLVFTAALIAVIVALIRYWLDTPARQQRNFWASRQHDHQLRQQELDNYAAAGELPVRVMRQYLTAEEMAWDQEEMEARGYELAHQPFPNVDGLIVVTYRLVRETHTA